jgi:hypothetical protein
MIFGGLAETSLPGDRQYGMTGKQNKGDNCDKDGSEAGMFLKTSERSQCASRERWERSGGGFSRLQSEVNVLLVKDGSEADADSQDFRAK